MSLLHHEFHPGSNDKYELSFSAWGEGILCEDALLDIQKPDKAILEFKEKYRRFPKSISLDVQDPREIGLDYCYTGIDPAMLEKFETLKELILPDSVTDIDVTPKLDEILKKNGTLIRGTFDSFAERFAAKLGLHFRPKDYTFANYFFEPTQESTSLTIIFKRNGSVEIEEKISSPGSSAGNTFGGSFFYSLDKEFYKQSAEDVASQFRNALNDAILESGRLAAFMEKARTHDYYKGKN